MIKKVVRIARKVTCFFSVELGSRIMYRVIMGKKLNLNPPCTFNEKIQYLKLFEYKDSQLATNCADKYAVREYIKSKGLQQYLNDLYFVFNSVDEIDWDSLPQSFVLKCNHGCTYNILCPDKNNFDIEGAKKKLTKWMSEDFSLVTAEPHYKHIKRKIICEKFLDSKIMDYKFFCFDGIPKLMFVATDRQVLDEDIKFDNNIYNLPEIKNLKSQLDEAKGNVEKFEREYDLNKAAEIKYGVIPKLEEQIKEIIKKHELNLIEESVPPYKLKK